MSRLKRSPTHFSNLTFSCVDNGQCVFYLATTAKIYGGLWQHESQQDHHMYGEEGTKQLDVVLAADLCSRIDDTRHPPWPTITFFFNGSLDYAATAKQ